MESITINGEELQILSAQVFERRNLLLLKNWAQPIKFYPNSNVLIQTHPGPCGFFASLQSIIIDFSINLDQNADPNHLLISTVLDIFSRISKYFAICDSIQKDFIHFYRTESRDEAYAYLLQNNFFECNNACIFLTVSFIFCSICKTQNIPSKYQFIDESLITPNSPYIYGDQNTAMSLAFLILNGLTNDRVIRELELNGYNGTTQMTIGIKVLTSANQKLIGTWLNPGANIFVCLKGLHFFTVLKLNDDVLIVYDNLKNALPYEVKKESINWK